MSGSIYQKRLAGPTQPGTAATTLYTAPAAGASMTNAGTTSIALATAIIKEIWLVNTTGSAATVTLGINGTAAANQIVPTISVAANDAKILQNLNIELAPTDTLQALQGTASAITVTVNGTEVN